MCISPVSWVITFCACRTSEADWLRVNFPQALKTRSSPTAATILFPFSTSSGPPSKITGRSDRIANIEGRTEVIDFKYTKKQSKYDLSEKTTVLKRFQEKGILHPAAQLISYQHFNTE